MDKNFTRPWPGALGGVLPVGGRGRVGTGDRPGTRNSHVTLELSPPPRLKYFKITIEQKKFCYINVIA